MSNPYVHDLHKFADSGLQLRVPVDLVPANQYARFTNATSLIEGEIVTRPGLDLIAQLSLINTLVALSGSGHSATTATTISPHYLVANQQVVIEVDQVVDGSNIALQQYTVTIGAVPTPTTFTFSPSISVTYASGSSAAVVGRVLGQGYGPTAAVQSIFRLNQALTGVNTERLAAIGQKLFRAVVPDGDFYELAVTGPTGQIIGPAGFSGNPLAIVAFRFTRDAASWAIIADQNVMYKYRPSGQSNNQSQGAYFEPLGNAVPDVAAVGSDGGVGNLNSTGGVGYDWRYTWVDGSTFTEGNPSPIYLTMGGSQTVRPTTYVNPYPSGSGAWINPPFWDGMPTTGAVTNNTPKGSSSAAVTAGVQWGGVAPVDGIDTNTLNVVADLSASGQVLGSKPQAYAQIQYSYDGGTTWQTLVQVSNAAPGKKTYSAVIPSSASLANVLVWAFLYAGPVVDGVDGNPNQASGSITDVYYTLTVEPQTNTLALVNKKANVCVEPSPYWWHRYINLYRRGGSLSDAWRLVGQFDKSALVQGACGAGLLTIVDNVSDTTLSTAALLELDNDQPVTSVSVMNQPLNFIWGPTNQAQILGCGDPARPECVYFSKNGNADAWPSDYFVEVSNPGEPIIGGCIYNTRNFAFSRERMYELVYGLSTNTTYTPFPTPCSRGLMSPWALCVGREIYFVSKDGVYASDGGAERSLVDDWIKPLFPTKDAPGQPVNGYEAVDFTQPTKLRLRWHNDEIYFVYAGEQSGERFCLVFDTLRNRWRSAQYSNAIAELFSEGNTISSLLVGTVSGGLYETGGSMDPTTLDALENVNIYRQQVSGVTLSAGTYYARVTRFDAGIESAISAESTAIVVDTQHSISAILPGPTANTTKWRLYYGTHQGGESQFQEFQEAALFSNRNINVKTAGSPGGPPNAISGVIPVRVSTGAHDQGDPLNRKEYDNVIVDLDPGGGAVTIMPLLNAEQQPQSAITVPAASGRQQVPLNLGGNYGFNLELDITWNASDTVYPVLYQYDILHRLDPVGVEHWESQDISLSMIGYYHVRDLYVAIRSTADVTFTLLLDGVHQQVYTLPSTGGERRKLYLQLASNKAKLYRFIFDSTAEFRLYDIDSETRAKPWVTALGYQIVKPFGSELFGGGGIGG